MSLLGDESTLANFLTHGFAELAFQVRPGRSDSVGTLQGADGGFRSLKIPVVVAFDQLEDLLLARRSDDAHKTAEAFFAGIVQTMHQVDGVCLIFAERGLGTASCPRSTAISRTDSTTRSTQHDQAVGFAPPPAELVRQVVEARLRPGLDDARRRQPIARPPVLR
ncbi:MAG: hypothetical protein U0746_14060 [Gemmataceae bacterium]